MKCHTGGKQKVKVSLSDSNFFYNNKTSWNVNLKLNEHINFLESTELHKLKIMHFMFNTK